MKIAVEGCGHGELDKIYAAMKHLEEREGVVIDLLICCGDFQAVRNLDDLECMSVPKKYLELGTFWKYYSGEAVAPYPTIFIGGNHEASNYLWELYYGGWVCPNIYYLGHSGVINFGDLRVGGLSGIFKSHDYRTGHHERPPYRGHEVKTAYHVRKFDADKLKAIREPVDVFLSHDWPRGIAHHGDLPALLRKKKFLADEIRDGSLGSPPAEELMRALRPRYWFSAHLHVKFAALVNHPEGDQTRFLALDKCLPRRDFLQVIDLPDKTPEGGFRLDPEWLAILRENHHRHSVDAAASAPARAPEDGAQRAWVDAMLAARRRAAPSVSAETAPARPRADGRKPAKRGPSRVERNPQTVELMDMLGLDFKLDAPSRGGGGGGRGGGRGGGGGGDGGFRRVRRFRRPAPAQQPPPPSAPPPSAPPTCAPVAGPGGAGWDETGVTRYPVGRMVPRHLPPPPKLADENEIDLDDDEDA